MRRVKLIVYLIDDQFNHAQDALAWTQDFLIADKADLAGQMLPATAASASATALEVFHSIKEEHIQIIMFCMLNKI